MTERLNTRYSKMEKVQETNPTLLAAKIGQKGTSRGLKNNEILIYKF